MITKRDLIYMDNIWTIDDGICIKRGKEITRLTWGEVGYIVRLVRQNKNDNLRTLQEWAALDGIRIIDPDGFDRTDPLLMERKFTREEFCRGIFLCTVTALEGKNENSG
jgi:hypothetical protein